MKWSFNIQQYYLLAFLGLFLNMGLKLHAQKLEAQVSKNKVAVGEGFQLAYTVNSGNCSDFRPPSLSDFDASGPSQNSSMQIINGNVSQSLTLSYYMAARKEGKFVIGPASIVANGKKIQSNSITIEVTKVGTNPGSSAPSAQPSSGAATSDDDLFVRTFVSKSTCFQGEQIIITHKIYSRVSCGVKDIKLPAYSGFWSQADRQTGQTGWQSENLDGIRYNVATIATTYAFPQHAGKLSIEPIELEMVVRRKSNRPPRDIFEQMMGVNGYEDVLVKIKSKPVSVDVSALPESDKPVGFSGAVGNFNFKAELSKATVKANDAVNLKITLQGKGNIKLVEAPSIVFPESFETYEPKINESIAISGGVSGTKTYDYLLIPRQSGDFVIKDLNFSYFDPVKKQYISIPSPEFKINVQPGAEGSSAKVYSGQKKHIEETENDIRYIKKGDLLLQTTHYEFFSSHLHYLLLFLPVLLLTGFIILRRRYIKANSNISLVKERQAAKVARKQLTTAGKWMKENRKDEFYNEVLMVLNRYLSDKLNISVAELSKESVKINLIGKQVKPETISQLLTTLGNCEMVKYAPGAISGDLQQVYNQTIELISNLEDELKA